MKNILVIAKGNSAKAFLEKIKQIDLSKKRFYILYYDEVLGEEYLHENFLLYKFDPTSKVKLHALLETHNFRQVYIILSNKTDTQATYENIRLYSKELEIVLNDRWQLTLDDPALTCLETDEILANMLANHLPDMPLYANNIGLGEGELVEIKIPFGSPFSYRYVSNIEQKRWRIVALYRHQKLILPSYNTTLEPNDSIIVVGNPNVLKSVYKSIYREFGQFPIPFGENIYLPIDMAQMQPKIVEKLINDAMLFHSSLNSRKLIFRVINPSLGILLDKIKSYDKGSMQVEIDFYHHQISEILINDVSHFQVGLLITDESFFMDHVQLLHDLHLPILKVGKSGFYQIKEAAILSSESRKVEKISSTIFDLSSQLKLGISIYAFDNEDSEFEKVVEHFKNLSKLFDEKVNVIKSRRNPLRELKDREDLLHIIPFDYQIRRRNILAFLSRNVNRLYFQLSNNYQLFLPSDE